MLSFAVQSHGCTVAMVFSAVLAAMYQELEWSVGRILTWYTEHQPCSLGVAWEWTDIVT